VTWKPRLIGPDELRAVADVASTVFGGGPVVSEQQWVTLQHIMEVDRTFAVADGDRIVGTAASFSFAMALPGGGSLPMAGVTMVGVLPTHRRQGMLRALMDALVDQALDREEPLAGLTASEATIYRRFGFGVAAGFQSLAVDVRRLGELVPPAARPVPGRMRLVTEAEAAVALPAAWERHWRRSPGELGRKPSWWPALAVDPEHERDGGSPRYVAVHDDADGQPDGFVVYRLSLERAGPRTLQVVDMAAADDDVEWALLRYLFDVDLVESVQWPAAPDGHPLPWAAADRRAVRVTAHGDHLWLRPLDMARCLAGRRYATAGGLVIEVVDEARPALGGRFRLDAGPGGADCERTTADADVVVAAPDLGSVLLGGVPWATLARAGRVEARTPGAAARADALFHVGRPPYCGTDF
jgi:predicted acetyltransferase